MGKRKKYKAIIRCYQVANAFLGLVALISFLADEEYQTADTLVPGAIIFQYIVTMIFLYYKYQIVKSNKDYKKVSKQINIFLGFFGFTTMASALFIGGYIYKFQICKKVFSIAATIWIASLIAAKIYESFYLSRIEYQKDF